MKRYLVCFCLILLLGVNVAKVSAESAVITFQADKDAVKVGEEFVIVVSVQGTAAISGVEANITYDSRMMTFLSGGNYVSGDSGSLSIRASALEGNENTRKFSLKFKAVAPGGCIINVNGKAIVTDVENKPMSVSSNRLSITVGGNGEDNNTQTSEIDDNGESGSETNPPLSGNNNLGSLRIHTGTLKPSFQPNETNYKATVDNETDNLFFSVKAEDPDAVVTIEGNEGMQVGSNKVKIIVKAPDGTKKTYKINVTRETPEETEQRLLKKNGGGGSVLTFHVFEKNGKVFLENSYRFEVVNVEDETLVPAGFIKTKVLLYGVNVTAYTMENDLDNDYLLIYAVNENGDKNFYQYDRVEKTLQRYSGDLIQKVNQNALSSKQKSTDEYNANLNQLAIIIAIISAICVLLLIAMIKMALKIRGVADYDELNLK